MIVLGLTALLNQQPQPQPELPDRGHPLDVLPVVVVLLVLWTFVLGRTSYGRHLYAVGGNAEAARRAGINVRRMKVSAFMIASTMAAIAASSPRPTAARSRRPPVAATRCSTPSARPSSAAPASSAAGAGPIDAVIGGVVIATIANGLGLLNQASYINYLVTGGVLLLAASVDAISRRRRSAAGV